jgi:hypothetical protein
MLVELHFLLEDDGKTGDFFIDNSDPRARRKKGFQGSKMGSSASMSVRLSKDV